MIEDAYEKLLTAEESLNDGAMFAKDRENDMEAKTEGVLDGLLALDKAEKTFTSIGEWIGGVAANALTSRGHYGESFKLLNGLVHSSNSSALLIGLAQTHQAMEDNQIVAESLAESHESLKKLCETIATAQQQAVDVAEQLRKAMGFTQEEEGAVRLALQGVRDYKQNL